MCQVGGKHGMIGYIKGWLRLWRLLSEKFIMYFKMKTVEGRESINKTTLAKSWERHMGCATVRKGSDTLRALTHSPERRPATQQPDTTWRRESRKENKGPQAPADWTQAGGNAPWRIKGRSNPEDCVQGETPPHGPGEATRPWHGRWVRSGPSKFKTVRGETDRWGLC